MIALPGADDLGQEGPWGLPCGSCPDFHFWGIFLGFGSSHRNFHSNHGPGTFPEPRVSCSACRWFESRLFRSEDGKYVIHFTGQSVVPGETPRYRYEVLGTTFELLEVLATRGRNNATGESGSYLSYAARRTLISAAVRDPDIRQAYERRWGG